MADTVVSGDRVGSRQFLSPFCLTRVNPARVVEKLDVRANYYRLSHLYCGWRFIRGTRDETPVPPHSKFNGLPTRLNDMICNKPTP